MSNKKLDEFFKNGGTMVITDPDLFKKWLERAVRPSINDAINNILKTKPELYELIEIRYENGCIIRYNRDGTKLPTELPKPLMLFMFYE